MEISRKRTFLKLSYPDICLIFLIPLECCREGSCIVSSWIILSPLGILIHRMYFLGGWSGQPLTWTPNGWAPISMGASPAQPYLMASPARKKLGAKLGDTCGKLWGHQMSNAGRFSYERKY